MKVNKRDGRLILRDGFYFNVTKTKIKLGETHADKYTWADF